MHALAEDAIFDSSEATSLVSAGVLMPFGDLFNHTPPPAPSEPIFGTPKIGSVLLRMACGSNQKHHRQ